jgi:hypothetical protein
MRIDRSYPVERSQRHDQRGGFDGSGGLGALKASLSATP